MTYLDSNDPAVRAAIERLNALSEFTQQTGFRTTRAANEILAKLSPEVLTAVVFEMRRNRKEDSSVHTTSR